jgi:hypothetical protein
MRARKAFVAIVLALLFAVPLTISANGVPQLGDLWYACVKDGGKIYGLTTQPPADCGPGDAEIILTAGDLNTAIYNAFDDFLNAIGEAIYEAFGKLEDVEIVSLNVNVVQSGTLYPVWGLQIPISHGVEGITWLGSLPQALEFKIAFDREDVSDCVFTGTPDPAFNSDNERLENKFLILTENEVGWEWPREINEIAVQSFACEADGGGCKNVGFSIIGRCGGTPDDLPPIPQE